MKRWIWGGTIVALLLTMSTILGPQPFHLPLQNPPRIANFPGNMGNRNDMTVNRENRGKFTSSHSTAEIAAQDMAITTALCVRDCRFALQNLTNQLNHTDDPAFRSRLIQTALKEHPQFRSITLRLSDGETISHGTPVQPNHVQESVKGVQQSGHFYVTDLYEGQGDKRHLFMSMALPILNQAKSVGIVTAEVEMGFLRSVADQVDNQMGTQTYLNSQTGGPVLFHPEKATIQSSQVTTHQVDGTKWHTSSSHVRSKSEDVKVEAKQNEVLVQFHREPDSALLAKIQSDINGVIVKRNSMPAFIFRSRTMSTQQLCDYFRKMNVKMVEPHRVMRQNDVPNDQLYERYQWNFPKIQIENAWNSTTGNPRTVIAVIDTGVDLKHPEFAGQLIEGRNMVEGNNNPQDDNGHGTHVSGVIVARTNNVEGVAGINWNSKVMPVKALGADGSGTVFDIADGIRWAVDQGAKVINLSLGEYEESTYLHEAIQYAAEKDVVVVAAMGNDDTDQPSYPAAYPEVLSVTAVDQDTSRATFSNYGSHAKVAAPGVSIPSTFPDHRYAAMSGTSMASPHVAGLAGLIRSINPDLKADQVKDIIMRTATDVGPKGADPYYGNGLINVAEAIQQAKTKPQDLAPTDQTPTPVQKRPWWWPFTRVFGM